MRIGFNPNKDQPTGKSIYVHQIVFPVYIPNQEDYFKDSLKILKLCIESLIKTVHNRTFITIVNNGSCQEVKEYLEALFNNDDIHELIHTENIGKLNAIIKGLVGNDIELVTISDADVLFLPNWQQETINVFNNVPKAGVVGVVPQFKMYEAHCGNVIFDNILNNKMSFLYVKNPLALERFYESIGWDKSYNKDYLKYNLGLKVSPSLNVLIGSGHFVATYKKEIFNEITSFIGYKLGGISETYLDKTSIKKGYWRLTTQENFAYHMGNTYEEWMEISSNKEKNDDVIFSNFSINRKSGMIGYYLKNRIFIKFISIPFLYWLFLKCKGLPKHMIKGY
ncbi:glycosyltransferase family A protein [Yeosuana sp. AK3]